VNSPVRQDEYYGYEDTGRGGRRARKWIITLVILIGVLVGIDFGAAAFAESTVSQKAREQLKLAEDPAVTINGFPFLTQAISGEYDHISMQAAGVAVGTLKDVELSAELRQVNAPLSDLIGGNVQSVTIGKLEGKATIKASDIAKVPPLNKFKDLKIEPASEDFVKNGKGSEEPADTKPRDDDPTTGSSAGIRMSVKADVAGSQTEVICYGMIKVSGTSIQIAPERMELGNDEGTVSVPSVVRNALLPNFKATIDTGDLPFKVTPTSVQVKTGAVTVGGTADNVKFGDMAGSSGGA